MTVHRILNKYKTFYSERHSITNDNEICTCQLTHHFAISCWSEQCCGIFEKHASFSGTHAHTCSCSVFATKHRTKHSLSGLLIRWLSQYLPIEVDIHLRPVRRASLPTSPRWNMISTIGKSGQVCFHFCR